MRNAKRLIHILFLGGILLFLLAGLFRTLVLPKDINYYENRYAYKAIRPGFTTVSAGTFQDSLENALSDQVPLAETVKSDYHRITNNFRVDLVRSFLRTNRDSYVHVLDTNVFGGENLVYAPLKFSAIAENLQANADSLNRIITAHPELEFFSYFIEKDTDVNFVTGEILGASDYMAEALELPADHYGVLQIRNFQDYQQRFLVTDHHWNYIGAYEGYTQVLELIAPGETPIEPLETVHTGLTFSGSKALTSGAKDIFVEEFTAYRFPEMNLTVTQEGQPAPDYGNQEAFLNGTGGDTISYSLFYGGDCGELILDAGQPDRPNLLVIGESFDNAILKLLATHFNRIYSIDLRYYEAKMGEPFRFGSYAAEHGIDQVLFIGSVDFYRFADFRPED